MSENTERKVGIVTFFKDNYGSALQCYATTVALEKLGYSPYVIEKQPHRMAKLLRLGVRCLCYPRHIKTFLFIRKKASSSTTRMAESDKQAMDEFIAEKLSVLTVDAAALKKVGKDKQFVAFLSGSDQIWGGHEYNIDSSRFLRFAPKSKRIAWSPSFGSKEIASYNRRIYRKYISDYAALSVREPSAVGLVEELTNKTPVALMDPVFLLTRDEWAAFASAPLAERYALCYFLDRPNDSTIQQINQYCQENKAKIIVFGPWNDAYNDLFAEHLHGSPQAFVSLIGQASCVFTDSFHALSFSLIMNTPFWVYQRNYAHGIDQSSRIKTLLEKVDMTQYFEPREVDAAAWDFSNSNLCFASERGRMQKFLSESLGGSNEIANQ